MNLEQQSLIRAQKTRARSWPLFPHYYSLFVLAVLSFPIVTSVRLAQDVSVQFWVGKFGYLAILLPFYVCVCHVLHVRSGRPSLLLAVLSSAMPCAALTMISFFHDYAGGVVASLLLSKDCRFESKAELQSSWIAAAALYEGLVNETAARQGISFADGLKQWRLQQFEEYTHGVGTVADRYASHRSMWQYLRGMEEHYLCAGWCHFSRPIWTFQEVRDSCSVVAGKELAGKVRTLDSALLRFAMIGFLVAILFMVVTGRELLKYGIEWGAVGMPNVMIEHV
eukprot:TRINITY_DN1799_c0_g1_i2.p1 TRINITY_DN1799_c0_g1~~TRINITY_DN1799_c0_g1_i2.p1  ORF type:complete len:281 (+),score=37.41 TRINITY_DN1799_c0_g1_i2:171-1013(+)